MVDISHCEKKHLPIGLGEKVVGLVFHRLGIMTFKALTEEGLLKEGKQVVVKSTYKLIQRLKFGSMDKEGRLAHHLF